MSSIRGVNVGGNLFDVTDSSNVAPIETTNFASRPYAKDRCFIMADGLLYRATAQIESGDPIVINGNCRRTTLDEIISVIETDSDLIAPTEDGATSSDDYAVGDEIVRSGILYKVISAISEDDAFVIGNNIEIAGSLTSQIQTVSNKVSNSGDAYSSSKAYKVGDLVIYDNKLYRCTTACSAAAWSVNQSCFIEDTLTNVVNSLNTHLPSVEHRQLTTDSNGLSYIGINSDKALVGVNIMGGTSWIYNSVISMWDNVNNDVVYAIKTVDAVTNAPIANATNVYELIWAKK